MHSPLSVVPLGLMVLSNHATARNVTYPLANGASLTTAETSNATIGACPVNEWRCDTVTNSLMMCAVNSSTLAFNWVTLNACGPGAFCSMSPDASNGCLNTTVVPSTAGAPLHSFSTRQTTSTKLSTRRHSSSSVKKNSSSTRTPHPCITKAPNHPPTSTSKHHATHNSASFLITTCHSTEAMTSTNAKPSKTHVTSSKGHKCKISTFKTTKTASSKHKTTTKKPKTSKSVKTETSRTSRTSSAHSRSSVTESVTKPTPTSLPISSTLSSTSTSTTTSVTTAPFTTTKTTVTATPTTKSISPESSKAVTTTSAAPTGTPTLNHKYKFVAYWGQNAVYFANGKFQSDILTYCQSGYFDVVNLAFLPVFGGNTPSKFQLSLANFGVYDNTNGPVDAQTASAFLQIGQQISNCQSLGVKVLLSLGGGAGSYSLPVGTGTAFAQTLHNSFFRGSSSDRPFGSVILDGIDWDLEGSGNDFGEIVKVNQYLHSNNAGLVVSAAPQCPYPDAYIGGAFLLPNSGFSFLNIQFYNNYCRLDGGSFNFGQWVDAIAIAHNIPLAIGLPGALSSAPSGGFVSASTVQSTINAIVANSTQAAWLYGVMVWDASSSVDDGLAASLRSILNSA
ncbi:glycoside hydrolase superfamily [Chytriomyces sp. MP71]|nr:glycoside hydrolase superfamily [Chytriomyces sp. MP71]